MLGGCEDFSLKSSSTPMKWFFSNSWVQQGGSKTHKFCKHLMWMVPSSLGTNSEWWMKSGSEFWIRILPGYSGARNHGRKSEYDWPRSHNLPPVCSSKGITGLTAYHPIRRRWSSSASVLSFFLSPSALTAMALKKEKEDEGVIEWVILLRAWGI